MKAYAFLKGIGILTFVIGCLVSLESLSRQPGEGLGTWLWPIGDSLVGFGIVVAVLGDLGGRVISIQEKLGALPEEDRLLRDDA